MRRSAQVPSVRFKDASAIRGDATFLARRGAGRSNKRSIGWCGYLPGAYKRRQGTCGRGCVGVGRAARLQRSPNSASARSHSAVAATQAPILLADAVVSHGSRELSGGASSCKLPSEANLHELCFLALLGAVLVTQLGEAVIRTEQVPSVPFGPMPCPVSVCESTGFIATASPIPPIFFPCSGARLFGIGPR